MRNVLLASLIGLLALGCATTKPGERPSVGSIYNPGRLKAVDSVLKVEAGDVAPDFTLPSLGGRPITLSQYRGKSNVVISFVPAAWTPVCSGQWPAYNLAEKLFKRHNTIVLGITVDNLPTLHAWTGEMGELWYPVLSDFWPHGEAAQQYGVLRTDGMTERALVVVDTNGIIRHIDVHDINTMPRLEDLVAVIEALD